MLYRRHWMRLAMSMGIKMKTALDLLEELLALTSNYVEEMYGKDKKKWQDISAKCADLRDGEEV